MKECIGFHFAEDGMHGQRFFEGDLQLSIGDKNYLLTKNTQNIFFITEQISPHEEFEFEIKITGKNSIHIEQKKSALTFFSSDYEDQKRWYKKNRIAKNYLDREKKYLIKNELPVSLNLWSEPFCQSLDFKEEKYAVAIRHQKLNKPELYGYFNYLGIYFDNIPNNRLLFDCSNDDLSFQIFKP